MSVFAIGDTHLSFSSEKPMDIFPGWQDHALRLKKNWNHLVGEHDTVVIPGDISWAMEMENAITDLKFLNELNGTKILLKGNHDYWWSTMSKLNAFKEQNGLDTLHFLFNNAYTADGIAVCGTRGWSPDDKSADSKIIKREAGRLELSLRCAVETGLEPVVFLHYPPFCEEGVCEEIYDVLLRYPVKRCFFGHLHYEKSDRYRKLEKDGIVFSLVSADFLEFCPKLIEKRTHFSLNGSFCGE